MGDPMMVRASDRERAAVEELLRRHHLAGRLMIEELEDRLAAVHRSVTLGELAALHADLPDDPPGPPARAARRPPPRIPGWLAFSERIELPASPDRIRAGVLADVAPGLASQGFNLVDVDDRHLRFVHRKRPPWTIALAILLFPFRLLALLYQEEQARRGPRDPAGAGATQLLVFGEAPLRVRRAFAELEL